MATMTIGDDDGPDGSPICTRHMAFETDSDSGEVIVRIWRPHRVSKTADDTMFECTFEIAGLPSGTIRSLGIGIDSMQALETAFSGVQFSLRSACANVSWLGMGSEELPLVLVVQDAGRYRRIVEILDEEEFALGKRFERSQTIAKEKERLRRLAAPPDIP